MIMKFIREPECKLITGLSRSTRWRLEKVGKFPKARQISPNTMGWLSNEIEEWMQSRIKDTDTHRGSIVLRKFKGVSAGSLQKRGK